MHYAVGSVLKKIWNIPIIGWILKIINVVSNGKFQKSVSESDPDSVKARLADISDSINNQTLKIETKKTQEYDVSELVAELVKKVEEQKLDKETEKRYKANAYLPLQTQRINISVDTTANYVHDILTTETKEEKELEEAFAKWDEQSSKTDKIPTLTDNSSTIDIINYLKAMPNYGITTFDPKNEYIKSVFDIIKSKNTQRSASLKQITEMFFAKDGIIGSIGTMSEYCKILSDAIKETLKPEGKKLIKINDKIKNEIGKNDLSGLYQKRSDEFKEIKEQIEKNSKEPAERMTLLQKKYEERKSSYQNKQLSDVTKAEKNTYITLFETILGITMILEELKPIKEASKEIAEVFPILFQFDKNINSTAMKISQRMNTIQQVMEEAYTKLEKMKNVTENTIKILEKYQ